MEIGTSWSFVAAVNGWSDASGGSLPIFFNLGPGGAFPPRLPTRFDYFVHKNTVCAAGTGKNGSLALMS